MKDTQIKLSSVYSQQTAEIFKCSTVSRHDATLFNITASSTTLLNSDSQIKLRKTNVTTCSEITITYQQKN